MSRRTKATRTQGPDGQLAEHADTIRKLGRRAIDDVIEIGRRLIECKDHLVGHGNWLGWLAKEFAWSEDTAERFMQACRIAGDSARVRNLNLPLSSFYALTARGTPSEVREELVSRAEAGEILSAKDIRRATAERKQPRVRPPKQGPAPLEASKTAAPQPATAATSSEELEQPRRRMTEVEYDRERARIGELYGEEPAKPVRKGRSPDGTGETAKAVQTRDNIGLHSSGEIERKLARLNELECEVVRLQRINLTLESENAELRAQLAAALAPPIADVPNDVNCKADARQTRAAEKSATPKPAPAPAVAADEDDPDIPPFLRRPLPAKPAEPTEPESNAAAELAHPEARLHRGSVH